MAFYSVWSSSGSWLWGEALGRRSSKPELMRNPTGFCALPRAGTPSLQSLMPFNIWAGLEPHPSPDLGAEGGAVQAGSSKAAELGCAPAFIQSVNYSPRIKVCHSLWLVWVEHFGYTICESQTCCFCCCHSGATWDLQTVWYCEKITKASAAIELGTGMPGWQLRKWQGGFGETLPINSCCLLVLEVLWILLAVSHLIMKGLQWPVGFSQTIIHRITSFRSFIYLSVLPPYKFTAVHPPLRREYLTLKAFMQILLLGLLLVIYF